jgi:membrane peptidoglycan carboxypeptidase
LLAEDFQVVEQARVSPALHRLIEWGIAPPYREPPVTGLEIRDAHGGVLYRVNPAGRVFSDFKGIPPLLVRTLLYIEDQQLDTPASAYSNPVIEWERLAKAVLLYAGYKVGLANSVQGGSTLALSLFA